MKQASRAFLCLVMALSYVFACMGFGIHVCHDDGSRHFVWMLGDVSCDKIHHHSHDADHDHHHDGHCCSTLFFVLSDAQDNAPGTADLSAPETALPLLATTETASPVLPARHRLLAWDAPPPITPLTQPLLSVWLV